MKQVISTSKPNRIRCTFKNLTAEEERESKEMAEVTSELENMGRILFLCMFSCLVIDTASLVIVLFEYEFTQPSLCVSPGFFWISTNSFSCILSCLIPHLCALFLHSHPYLHPILSHVFLL